MAITSPQLKVEIDFSNGPNFGYPVILDDIDSLLDQAILGLTSQDVVDVSNRVLRCSTRRGRNRILSNFEVGTATVVLNDPNADFSPTNDQSEFWDPVTDTTKLLPLRKIRISANVDRGALGIVNYVIYSGYITSYDTSFYQGTNETSTVTLQCADAFRLLNNVATETTPVTGCPAGQLSGARINALLDFAGFPNSMREIDVGNSTMQADPGGIRSVLQAIQTIEQSEFGAFFVDNIGDVKFYDRNTVSVRADQNPRTFTDTGSASDYNTLDFAYDDQLVLNNVTVTRYDNGVPPAPVPQNIKDQASIDIYFNKSGSRSGILVETDTEANDQARTIVGNRKKATQRIDSMGVTLIGKDDDKIAEMLTVDIYNLLNVSKSMPGGSIVELELFCQGVAHDISVGKWNTTIYTAEPIIQAFILDSNEQGILADQDNQEQYTNVLTY